MKLFLSLLSLLSLLVLADPIAHASSAQKVGLGFNTTLGPIAGFSAELAMARRAGRRQICLPLFAENGHLLYVFDVDSGEALYLFDSTTLLENGDVARIMTSCSIGPQFVVLVALLADFITPVYIVQDLLADGQPDGDPRIVLKGGDVLPNGHTFSFPGRPAVNSAGFAFKHDITGVYFHDALTQSFTTLIDTDSTYPGSSGAVNFFSDPLLTESTATLEASGQNGGAGIVTANLANLNLDEAVPMGTSAHPVVVLGVEKTFQLELISGTFDSFISLNESLASSPFVEPGAPLPGGLAIAHINELWSASAANYFFRGAGDANGACVFYNATLASDPSGPPHLIRTCQGPSPAEPESEIILSSNQVIDDVTIDLWDPFFPAWEVSPEAAAGFDIVVKAHLDDGGTALIFIGDLPQTDADSDGVADTEDNCIQVANADQRDTDSDGIGNLCDPDVASPNDCAVNFTDLNVYKENFFAQGDLDTDNNGDGVTNFVDLNTAKAFFFGPPGPSATGCN